MKKSQILKKFVKSKSKRLEQDKKLKKTSR